MCVFVCVCVCSVLKVGIDYGGFLNEVKGFEIDGEESNFYVF